MKSQEDGQRELYIYILERFEVFFNALGQIIRKTPNIQIFEEIYKIASMAIVKIQYHLPQT